MGDCEERNSRSASARSKLNSIAGEYSSCKRCSLSQYRTRVSTYVGEAPCDVLFIGASPGRAENASGKPFSGSSYALFASWKLELEPVRSAGINLLGCRSCRSLGGKNCGPSHEHLDACEDRTLDIVRALSPSAFVCLGKDPVHWLIRNFGGDVLFWEFPATGELHRLRGSSREEALLNLGVLLRTEIKDLANAF